MASYIPDDCKSVLDVGCGKMWLKEFLKPSVKYYGLDYVARDDETIVCDLNKREFPDIKTDVCFCSGVIAYVNEENLDWFCKKLRETSPILLISYNTRDLGHYQNYFITLRKMRYFKNHMKRKEFINLLEKAGFKLETRQKWDSRTEIFKFV